jgi:hypothetical protein
VIFRSRFWREKSSIHMNKPMNTKRTSAEKSISTNIMIFALDPLRRGLPRDQLKRAKFSNGY